MFYFELSRISSTRNAKNAFGFTPYVRDCVCLHVRSKPEMTDFGMILYLGFKHFVYPFDDTEEANSGAQFFSRMNGVVERAFHDVVACFHLNAIEVELQTLGQTFCDVAEQSEAVDGTQTGVHFIGVVAHGEVYINNVVSALGRQTDGATTIAAVNHDATISLGFVGETDDFLTRQGLTNGQRCGASV